MMLYVENPQDATWKLSNEFGKPAGYTNNEISEREITETVLYIIASKGVKYLGINLPK